MPLTSKERQQMKARAHKMSPLVIIGNQGLSANVNTEIDRGLYDHELIKIRVNVEDRVERRNMFDEICDVHHAELVQQVGKIGVVYRVSDKQKA